MSVTVNGKKITDEEIYQEMQHHPADSVEAAADKAAKALVIKELLLQEAINLNVQVDGVDSGDGNYDAALIDALFTEVIKTPELDDNSIGRFYQNNIARFKQADGAIMPLDTAKEFIEEYMMENFWQNSIREYIRKLALDAKISGVTLVAL